MISLAIPLILVSVCGNQRTQASASQTGQVYAATQNRVLPAGAMATKLGGLIGVQVAVVPPLDKVPVFVVDNGRPPIEILSSVAEALHASLVKSRHAFTIVRTEADQRQNREQSVRLVRNELKREFTRIDAEVGMARRYGTISRQVAFAVHRVAASIRDVRAGVPGAQPVQTPPTEFTPAGRLLRAAIERIGLDRLSVLTPGETRVFSNDPTAAEEPIDDCEAAITKFVAEQNDYFKEEPYDGFSKDAAALGDISLSSRLRIEPASKLKLILSEVRRWDGIAITLRVFNDSGAMLCGTGLFTRHIVLAVPFSDSVKPIMAMHTSQWARLRPDSLDYVAQFANDFLKPIPEDSRPAALAAPTDRAYWPDMVLHPEVFEPNHFVVEEALSALAMQDTSKAFVAAIPDSLWEAANASVKADQICLDAFLSILESAGHCEKIQNAHVVLVRPQDALEADRCVFDRRAVGYSVRNFVNDRRISLAAWSEYRLHTPNPDDDCLVRFFDQKLLRSSLPRVDRLLSAPNQLFKILGALNENNTLTDSSSKTVRVEEPPTVDYLSSMLDSPGFLAQVSGLKQSQQFRAEIYPSNHILAEIELAVSREPAYEIAVGDKLVGSQGYESAGVFAGQFFDPFVYRNRERFDAKLLQAFDRSDVKFFAGQRLTYHVRIDLPLRAHRDFEFTENSGLADPPATFSDIPRKFWDDAFREMSNSKIVGPMPSGPVRQTPPPP